MAAGTPTIGTTDIWSMSLLDSKAGPLSRNEEDIAEAPVSDEADELTIDLEDVGPIQVEAQRMTRVALQTHDETTSENCIGVV